MQSPFDKLEQVMLKRESVPGKPIPKKVDIFQGFTDGMKALFSKTGKDEVKDKIKFSLPGEAKSIGAAIAIAVGVMLMVNEVPNHPLIVLGVTVVCLGFCYLFR